MYFTVTDAGLKREINEDYFLVKNITKDISLYIVADGLGGYKAGEIASKLCVTTIYEYLEDKFDNIYSLPSKEAYVKMLLETSIKLANEKVYALEKTDEKYKGMGTTVCALLKINTEVYYVSIGDSRIYYIDLEKNEIMRITEDDTYVNSLLKNSAITKAEASHHPQKHVLTKAIGVFEKLDIVVKKTAYEKGYVLMCTDGVTNMITDTEILKIFENENIDNVAKVIVNTANKNGGTDNSTAVVIDIKTENKGE